MTLVTELVSFFAKNDKYSLYNKLIYFKKNADKIFTRKFIHIRRNDYTGEVYEEEAFGRPTNINHELNTCIQELERMASKNQNPSSFFTYLIKARNTIYCHYDLNSIDLEKANKEILSLISTEYLEKILDCICRILNKLEWIYYNRSRHNAYTNCNDILNIFSLIKETINHNNIK